MTLIDTHCHIHEPDYPLNVDDVIARARQAGVTQLICVGTNEADSRQAIEFASNHDGMFASAGVHPHYAKDGLGQLAEIIRFATADNFSIKDVAAPDHKLVAVGEIGLDYHYNYSPRDAQIQVLQAQIELALKYDLPIIFHVREAFDDFWPVFDNFRSDSRQIRGVLHGFTDNQNNADEGLKRGLYIGINGFSTFTKDDSQKAMFARLPLNKLILETDAPFLTPVPFRGKVNEPAFVKTIAEYCGVIRQISVDEVANVTTANAQTLFKF